MKSKSFFTPMLLISFPMVLGNFSPHLTQQGGEGEMSFNSQEGLNFKSYCKSVKCQLSHSVVGQELEQSKLIKKKISGHVNH